jgi:hypothetical protein
LSSHLETLRQRRLAIIAGCDQDREQLAAAFHGIEHELRIADRVVATAQRLKSNPVIVGVLAVGTILAPVLARKWVRRAASWLPIAIQAYRMFKGSRRRADSTSE